MKLYICEKPSQGRDLARNLALSGSGNGFIGNSSMCVTWAIGHMVMQSNPEEYDAIFKDWKASFDRLPCVPNVWKMNQNPKTKKQLSVVRGLLKKATEVVIATDGDREGEVIGRELLDFYNYKGLVNRLWLTALDDKSIQKALKNVKQGNETQNLYYAGLGRSRADWLVGINLTRLISVKAQMQGYQDVLSVGRVQTPTLAIVVNRDIEIDNFVSHDYFDIQGVFSGLKANWQCFVSGVEYSQDCDSGYFDSENRCIDIAYAEQVVSEVNSGSAKLTVFATSRKKIPPPLLYSLSKLQQVCSKKFGFGAKQVLDLAQSLYEKHKATTYPRSDCQYLPESQLSEVKDVMSAIQGIDSDVDKFIAKADLLIKSKAWNDKKISAHHGIIPTANNSVNVSSMTTDECKLYDLICRSYIAQFYPHYEYDKTDIEINASDELFKSNINIDVNLGWKVVINPSADKKTAVLPAFSVGQDLSIDSVDIENKQTNPPARYTEGSLIASMEKAHLFITDDNLKKILKGNEGIGTEATRANIIETLIKRNFIKKSKKSIVSTSVGKDLINIVPDALKDPGMTAMLESSLDKIASGELSLDDYLVWQVDWLEKLIETIKQNPLDIKTDAKSYPCPDCDSPMFLKKSKKAQFWGCSNYPTCNITAQNNAGKPLFEKDMPDCPKCGKKLRKLKGKKGYFWSCKGYFDDPKCDFITNDKGGKPVFK